MEQKWFYVKNGEKQGPVSEIALSELISLEEIASNTIVWREGMDEWSELSTCKELAQSLIIKRTPPPIPRDRVKANIPLPLEPAAELDQDTSHSTGQHNPKKLMLWCSIVTIIFVIIEGLETGGLFYNIGQVLGIFIGYVSFTYIVSGVPLVGYYLIKKGRSRFEARIIWGVFIVFAFFSLLGALID